MLQGRKINMKKKKKNETGFDLLQTDGYDITNINNNIDEPEFSEYEIDTTDFETSTAL